MLMVEVSQDVDLSVAIAPYIDEHLDRGAGSGVTLFASGEGGQVDPLIVLTLTLREV